MKKKLLAVLVLFLGTILFADGLKFNVDGFTTATFYDYKTRDIFLGLACPVISFKDFATIDIGILSDVTSMPIYLIGAGMNIKAISELLGLGYLLQDPVCVGGFWGRDLQEQTNYYGGYFGVRFSF